MERTGELGKDWKAWQGYTRVEFENFG